MLISARKRNTASGIGIVASLTMIVGGAAAFLILLHGYTQATMSPQDNLVYAAPSLDETDANFYNVRSCFEAAPKTIAASINQPIFSQIIAARSGDLDGELRCMNGYPNSVCARHRCKLLLETARIASATHFFIDSTRISDDQTLGAVFVTTQTNCNTPENAVYFMVLNNGIWKVQCIQATPANPGAQHGNTTGI